MAVSGSRASVAHAIRTLNPGYFALVMGTGIVSVGIRIHHLTALSVVLMYVAIIGYVVLVVLHAARAVWFGAQLRADFAAPARAFGFFTFSAATDVLGTRLALDGHPRIATVLLVIGWLSWLVLGYVVPWRVALARTEDSVLLAANGTWFIWAVATQSVAVLAATLQPTAGDWRGLLTLLAVFSWSIGVFLYAAVGSFVALRLLTRPVRPADITPPYWVAMGATAITDLAAARILQTSGTPMLTATRGLIDGAVVVFWAFGSWLIPALIAAGLWRHVVHRVPLRYEAPMWSVVFPLGMYGVAGHFVGEADRLPIVAAIGDGEIWVALAVWAAVFAAMLAHLARVLHPRTGSPRAG